MIRLRPCVVVVTIAALAAFALSGCVTAKKYRLAKEDTPPAVPLNLTAGTTELDFRLVSVIVYDGPGSWKQRARWDEYVVSLGNRGAMPLTVGSFGLVDLLGVEQVPGTDPWKLERLSETNWEKYARSGNLLVMGVGAVGAMELAAVGYGLTGGVVSGLFFLMPVAILADVTTVAVMNHRNKGKVEQEFARRRLVLPLTLAAGQTVTGSLFLPMTPGPQRLILKGAVGASPFELVLDLKPLAGLHLKPAETKQPDKA